MKLIQIYNKGKPVPGMFAKVDDEDYKWLSKYRWGRSLSRKKRYYPWTSWPIPGGIATIYMHKLILNTSKVVDHLNNDPLDCQRHNLRECNQNQNQWNRGKPKRSNGQLFSSQFKGVCFVGGKWLVAITCHGKRHRIGLFDDEEEAARAYDAKAKELHREFASLNFPE